MKYLISVEAIPMNLCDYAADGCEDGNDTMDGHKVIFNEDRDIWLSKEAFDKISAPIQDNDINKKIIANYEQMIANYKQLIFSKELNAERLLGRIEKLKKMI